MEALDLMHEDFELFWLQPPVPTVHYRGSLQEAEGASTIYMLVLTRDLKVRRDGHRL